jgi:hypothetical protein
MDENKCMQGFNEQGIEHGGNMDKSKRTRVLRVLSCWLLRTDVVLQLPIGLEIAP